MNRITKIFILIISAYLFPYCNEPLDRSTSLLATENTFDSLPFGLIQSLLNTNTPGEHLLRIDSLKQTETNLSIYYVTDKGIRTFELETPFPMLVIKGYQADGSNSCVRFESGIYKCYDSACTLVVDTMQVQRSKRPYPVLYPEKDSIAAPCPPLLTQKAS